MGTGSGGARSADTKQSSVGVGDSKSSTAADAETQTSASRESRTAADGETPAGAGAGAGVSTGAAGSRRRRRKRSFWRELPVLIAVALILAVVIKTYALQAFFIPSGSMENTLDVNDRVLINKLVYDFRGIHRGDIVVFTGEGSWDPGPAPASSDFFSQFLANLGGMFGFGHPGDIYVKRVVGLPGDHVACCDAQGRVTVNGVPLDEGSYLHPGDAPSLVRFNFPVPPGRLWVMGDHRYVSDDSRGHLGQPGGGTIPENAVLGRAFIIIWPPSRWRILPIPATFTQPALSKPPPGAAGARAGTGTAAADILGARLEPSGPALPLSLGFAGALPLTWLHRGLKIRAAIRRGARGREIP